MALLRQESKLMQEETERMSIGKQLWWYVVLRGGLIFGVLYMIPAHMLIKISSMRPAGNGALLTTVLPGTTRQM
jgi:hypothetical protein